ncbi:MAG: hypothetical protein M2R45_05050 [Verrucomicrobia subdivision 3 bacterium]|nr:hypothetical protein [Limisphaerales bacterium]MCS1412547.1 hypothetical protein [Limisphaerales bacterium]
MVRQIDVGLLFLERQLGVDGLAFEEFVFGVLVDEFAGSLAMGFGVVLVHQLQRWPPSSEWRPWWSKLWPTSWLIKYANAAVVDGGVKEWGGCKMADGKTIRL